MIKASPGLVLPEPVDIEPLHILARVVYWRVRLSAISALLMMMDIGSCSTVPTAHLGPFYSATVLTPTSEIAKF